MLFLQNSSFSFHSVYKYLLNTCIIPDISLPTGFLQKLSVLAAYVAAFPSFPLSTSL
jgi:hypothetical protein